MSLEKIKAKFYTGCDEYSYKRGAAEKKNVRLVGAEMPKI